MFNLRICFSRRAHCEFWGKKTLQVSLNKLFNERRQEAKMCWELPHQIKKILNISIAELGNGYVLSAVTFERKPSVQ